jgi:dolichyl-phosphate-mannose-protein mannosyltransferase
MSSEKGAVASGLESDNQSTRRRNVPSTSPNGGMVNRVEIDEKKTQIKKVSFENAAERKPFICTG